MEKKIVLFTKVFAGGGAERVLCNLANHWTECGIQVFLISCFDGELPYQMKNEVVKMGLLSAEKCKTSNRYLAFLSLCKLFCERIKEIKPVAIVSFLPMPNIISILTKNKHRVPVICSERSNPKLVYRHIPKPIINFIYSQANGFVFQTEGAQNYFNKKVTEKSRIIGNPVNVKSEIDFRKVKKRIVAVGRFSKEKNYPLLIRAFAAIHNEFPEYVLEIYGRIDESLQIRQLCEALSISDSVIFHGHVKDIESYIKDASVYVLSSSSEGMPNALLEAMAIGLPCVATDCPSGGVRQIIKNGMNGILVPNGDTEKLADGILLLLKDRELACKLGEKAKNIKLIYSDKNIYRQWDEYIDNIIKNK